MLLVYGQEDLAVNEDADEIFEDTVVDEAEEEEGVVEDEDDGSDALTVSLFIYHVSYMHMGTSHNGYFCKGYKTNLLFLFNKEDSRNCEL